MISTICMSRVSREPSVDLTAVRIMAEIGRWLLCGGILKQEEEEEDCTEEFYIAYYGPNEFLTARVLDTPNRG